MHDMISFKHSNGQEYRSLNWKAQGSLACWAMFFLFWVLPCQLLRHYPTRVAEVLFGAGVLSTGILLAIAVIFRKAPLGTKITAIVALALFLLTAPYGFLGFLQTIRLLKHLIE